VTGQSPLPGVASWGGAESVAKNSTTEYTTQINPVCTCDGHAAVALPEGPLFGRRGGLSGMLPAVSGLLGDLAD
jgi:hypothetical protein